MASLVQSSTSLCNLSVKVLSLLDEPWAERMKTESHHGIVKICKLKRFPRLVD